MSNNYHVNEIDSIFDNENNDLNNDALLSDKIWSNDDLSITSNEIDWDKLICDDMLDHSFDQISDKTKDRYFSDFDYNLSEFNDFLKSTTAKNPIKVESTNSVTSSYMTDDCSPTSSYNSSPVIKKIKRENIKLSTNNCSNDRSQVLFDNDIDSLLDKDPLRSSKLCKMNNEPICQNPPRTIYKVARNVKFDKTRDSIIIGNVSNNQRQIVKIRQAPTTSTPCIISGSIKSVNISRNTFPNKNANENFQNKSQILLKPSTLSKNNQFYHPQIVEEDYDLLNGEYYDQEFDAYPEYIQHGTNTGSLFQTPIPQSGPLYLTDEERKTLLQENYPIPTRVPLTKQEERNLKKVRRKIKNKLSAQESRRKKKEYVDALEKKVELYEQERIESKRRIEMLEHQQKTLQNQIRHYQNLVMNKISGTASTASTGLMLFVICFALILVGGSLSTTTTHSPSPQSSFISGLSFYYMGYGPSRNSVNYSNNLSLHRIDVKHKENWFSNKTDKNDYIIPRQSILLEEDADRDSEDHDDIDRYDEIEMEVIEQRNNGEAVSWCGTWYNKKICSSVIRFDNLTIKNTGGQWFRHLNENDVNTMGPFDAIDSYHLRHRNHRDYHHRSS